ncbi:biopolymer transport protein ExbB [Nitrosomonas aestuarii]|uniref:Biopolymer transport protein ExbB n=1 Tax=Nitrosomonas aestuarii TaxID=52441 RepID=A0A1I3XT21_9PROT|nr:MotA/TolQ/ExbB proton channel family protein [Nitrosomonas aestuarii]SFK22684.1 biopolymer transport protein ExbB [Nitrosomonas aestuarii]
MENHLGLAYFLDHIDHVGMSVAILLFSLSAASWYLIITKSIGNFIATRRAKAFLKQFWETRSLRDMNLKDAYADNAFARLAQLAADTEYGSQQSSVDKPAANGGTDGLLTRTLRNGIEQEAARVEHGLTLIASAGSAAPYIGLFGTVWGIYHALIQIGFTGQGTLEKVAGPVGEALIMTALGLAVAIPAVLAYNAFFRRNRLWMAKLDAFAHELFIIVTMGGKNGINIEASVIPDQPQQLSPALEIPAALEGKQS